MKNIFALFLIITLIGCSGSKMPNIGWPKSSRQNQDSQQIATKNLDSEQEKNDDDDGIKIPAPKGNLRYSIAVSSFENKSNWAGQWNLGNGFTEILIDALKQSGWFLVIADKEMRAEAMAEQDFALTGRTAVGKKTPKVGRLTPAQLLTKGVITHAQGKTVGGSGLFNIRGIRLGGSGGKAEVNITLYIVDSETGQVKASKSIVGQSNKKGLALGYHGGGLGGVTGDVAGYKKDNMGKACEHAVAQAVLFLIEQLDHIPWEGTIALVKFDGTIIVNRGSREGVQVGNKFHFGNVQEVVDPDTGEVLDRDMNKLGLLEVTEVKEKVAYCKALEGGDQIEKGMSIYPTR